MFYFIYTLQEPPVASLINPKSEDVIKKNPYYELTRALDTVKASRIHPKLETIYP